MSPGRSHIIAAMCFFPLVSVFTGTRYRHFSTAQGLSDNTVYAIHQDRFGLMWFGTDLGLDQFDGYGFSGYHHDPSDSTSLGEGGVLAIVDDPSGNLWIGTSGGGVSLFDRASRRFRRLKVGSDSDRLPDVYVKCLLFDRQGRLWIGTGQGLCRYDPISQSFGTYLSGYSIKALFEDSRGLLWVGTAHDGLYVYHPAGDLWEHLLIPSDPPHAVPSAVEAIIEDPSGRLWIGTLDGGLYRFDPQTRRFIHHPFVLTQGRREMVRTVFSLLCDRSGLLWIGTENAGLIRLDPQQGESLLRVLEIDRHDRNDLSSVSNNTIRSLYEDRDGNVWVGTFSGGVNLKPRYAKPFENHKSEPFNPVGLSHNLVRCFLEDEKGNLWVGTDGGGLNYLDRKGKAFVHYLHDPSDPWSLSDDHVLGLSRDPDGSLWIATWNGLNLFDVRTKRFRRFFHDPRDPFSLSHDKTTCVLDDGEGRVWVGTMAGLNVFDKKEKVFSHVFEGEGGSLSERQILCLFLDREETLWIGTVWGFFFLPKARRASRPYGFTYLPYRTEDSGGLSHPNVQAILPDCRGQVWIATPNGLDRFDPEGGTFRSYTIQDGLPSNRIASLVEDGRGRIWFGTNKGIAYLDPETEKVVTFDSRDGLVGDDFTQAALRTQRGELAFGSKQGITLFHPDSLRFSPSVPPVILIDFFVLNRPVALNNFLEKKGPVRLDSLAVAFRPWQNVFAFEFAALDYTAPAKNRYRYRMEGFDTEWRYTDSKRRFATYTNLPPGRYCFRVQGSNCDGVWNEKGLTIAVQIHPPFWRSRWAIFLYAGCFLALLTALRALILYRERMKTELLLERKEAERIHALDTMRLRFFTNISHEFKSPVTLIIGMLEQLLRSETLSPKILKYHLGMMLRNARRLLRLINQILDIRRLEAGGLRLQLQKRDIVRFVRGIYSVFLHEARQRAICFEWASFADRFPMWFDPDKIDKVLYNLLSNAFKYTEDGGTIRLSLDRVLEETPHGQGEFLLIRVEDTGIGIPPEYLDKVFDPFVRVETEGQEASPGTGLGLSFAKELVGLHRGDIMVASEEGKGSCFTVKLPMSLGPMGEEADAPCDTEVEELESEIVFEGSMGSSGGSPDTHPLVLIVDDDLDFLYYLKEELGRDYRVIEAYHGESAFEIALQYQPNLILSDLRMPKMDGLALCDAIKRHEKTAHIPFVLLTSVTDLDHRIQGFDHGADEVIAKPFDREILLSRLRNLIAIRKHLQSHFSHEVYLEPQNIPITPEEERFLTQVTQCLEAHIENPEFGVEALGREVGLSRVQLYRRIKSLTGMNPNDLIRTFRLKRSAQLILKSHMTISEISYRVGFRDPSYFCRCFRQQFGLPPLEYARRMGGGKGGEVIVPLET